MSMPETKSNEEVRAALAQLVHDVRTGVLLSLRGGHPFGSHVPYVLGNDWSRVYLHLSRLALHTRHVSADSRVSLFIAEPDKPEKNPSALQRVNLQGDAVILPRTDAAYETVRQLYILKFPQSELMFGFEDFALWELRMTDAHLVLGFGQAYQACSTNPEQWLHQKPGRTT